MLRKLVERALSLRLVVLGLAAVLAALAIIAAAVHGMAGMAVLAGLAMLAACLAFAGDGGSPGVLLFSAAALLGLARAPSASAVEQPPAPLRRGMIGGLR